MQIEESSIYSYCIFDIYILAYLVDTMNCCEIGSHHDALVYTAGAIKHLSSNNSTTQKELVSLGGIEGLGKILDAISKDVCSCLIRRLLEFAFIFINENVLDLPKTYKSYIPTIFIITNVYFFQFFARF